MSVYLSRYLPSKTNLIQVLKKMFGWIDIFVSFVWDSDGRSLEMSQLLAERDYVILFHFISGKI